MRTSLLLSILAAMIVAPAAQSQDALLHNESERVEAVAPEAAATPSVPQPRTTEAPRTEQTAPAFEVAQTASPAPAAREVSARTVLAIVGGVLIVVALISLLR